MTTNKPISISKDIKNKKVIVEREFDAPVEQVWKAWTKSDLLDRWWAPRPWRAQTKEMDFREGGYWLYSMVGPDGNDIWARVDYTKINTNKSFTAMDSFCDENGNKNNDLPSMHWKNEFLPQGKGTKVRIEITFSSEADLQKIMEMGFEEGFTSALGNLDEIFARQDIKS